MSLNEFGRLLDRFYQGECSPEEQKWIEQWLGKATLGLPNAWQELSPDKRQAFIDQLYADISLSVSQHDVEEPEHPRKPLVRRLWWLGAAASICLFVFAYLFVQQRNNPKDAAVEWKMLVAEPGFRKQIQLSDGTTIWLQGGSELAYPAKFGGSRRLVRLDGEAYFDVAHNPDTPFVVRAGDLETEVLGTSFNIEAFSEFDKKVVSLVEGKVAVRIRDSSGTQRGREIIMKPDEAVVYNRLQDNLTKRDGPVYNSPEDFKTGNLQFDGVPIGEVLSRLGVAYGVTVQYDREDAKKHKITGNYTTSEPIDNVFQSLVSTIGAKYYRKEKTVIIKF